MNRRKLESRQRSAASAPAHLDLPSSEALTSALSFLTVGVAIISASGELAQLNAAAERTISENATFTATSSELQKRVPGAAPIQRFINALSEPNHGKTAAATLMHNTTLDRFHIFVLPLRNGRTPAGNSLVFICNPRRRLTATEETVRDLYQFTSAEARLACELMNGCTLDEAAAKLKIKNNTARSHLKRIFSKTETRRQGDVVRLLTATFSVLDLSE